MKKFIALIVMGVMFLAVNVHAARVWSAKVAKMTGNYGGNEPFELSSRKTVAPGVYEFNGKMAGLAEGTLSNKFKILVNCDSGLYKVSILLRNDRDVDQYGNVKGASHVWSDLGWESYRLNEWPNRSNEVAGICKK